MLQEKINKDLKEAMKAGDSVKVGVFRMLNSALKNEQIKKGKDVILTEDDTFQILFREAKKRKESIAAFIGGGRPDLAEGEKKELEIIEEYLPKQMSREEIIVAIDKILSTISDKTPRSDSLLSLDSDKQAGQGNFGLVMKEVMKELKGKGDAKIISEVLKEKIS